VSQPIRLRMTFALRGTAASFFKFCQSASCRRVRPEGPSSTICCLTRRKLTSSSFIDSRSICAFFKTSLPIANRPTAIAPTAKAPTPAKKGKLEVAISRAPCPARTKSPESSPAYCSAPPIAAIRASGLTSLEFAPVARVIVLASSASALSNLPRRYSAPCLL